MVGGRSTGFEILFFFFLMCTFLEIRGTLLEVPIIGMIIYFRVYIWVPRFLGNCQP